MASRSFEASQGEHDMPLMTLLVNGSTTLIGMLMLGMMALGSMASSGSLITVMAGW